MCSREMEPENGERDRKREEDSKYEIEIMHTINMCIRNCYCMYVR